MTTSSIKEIWNLMEIFKKEIHLLMADEALVMLLYLHRHEGISKSELTEKLSKYFDEPKPIIEFLLSNTFIEDKEGKLYLSEGGKSITKVIECSAYDISKLPKDIIPGYVLEEPPLGKGSTSVTFKAIKEKTGFDIVLKIFKPGVLDHINFMEKIKRMRSLTSVTHLIIPHDYGEVRWNGITLNYVEMEYVKGVSLGIFLRSDINIDLEETLTNYVKEVGTVLQAIQESGLNHGDLHENNILMVEDELYKERNIFHFKVIDFIGVNSNEYFRRYELTDMEYFKENFLKIVKKYAITPSGNLDKRKLGERLTHLTEDLTANKYSTFVDVIKSLSKALPSRRIIDYEQPFTYLIFETYDVNQPLWLKRFELESTIYDYFTDFRPLICSGPRGCGKTIYLRFLSFIPKIVALGRNDPDIGEKIAFFKNIFGIYFACRQGEFKVFSEKSYKFDFPTQLFLKHILVLKIIRRTLSLIDEAYSEKVFATDPRVTDVIEQLSKYLTRKPLMTSTARQRPFKELTSILRNEENYCIDMVGEESKYPPQSGFLNEHILIEFFRIIRKGVSELADVKFYIIFDDLSEPQVSVEMQKILNCLISCHNEVYCCKFSTDKYAYTFEDMFGKALQVPHDYTYLDLSNIENYEQYLERIINRQLDISKYTKTIKEHLEESPYSPKELVSLLSMRDYGKVKFAGWDLIVQLSSWSVRDALVICETIFKTFGGKRDQDQLKRGETRISVDIQNRAIRKYSEEVYASVINIEYVGKEIFDIVRNFGEISRDFLRREITKEGGRRYEVIAVERKDNKKISDRAEDLLRKLIRHSVFLDRGLSFSREQIGLVQKFTMHKKFAPALMISYREREHLRLSKDQLEDFLLKPDEFREKVKKYHEGQLEFDFKKGRNDG